MISSQGVHIHLDSMGSHTTLEAPRANVFGWAPAYGHVPSPAELQAKRRARVKGTARSVGEGLLVVAAVAASRAAPLIAAPARHKAPGDQGACRTKAPRS